MQPLIALNNLCVSFQSETGTHTALKGISFTVNRGEIVALVGESGSGKSVTSLSILQLLPSPPALYTEGSILFSNDGEATVDLLRQDVAHLRQIRGNQIAMIFQEPMTSLNPVVSCGQQVMEAILTHKKISRQQAKQQTINWFEKVKLPNPEVIFSRYPHQLSGGQKQRVMIAMAMCCEPSLLICDEPTTALDVTVQRTILDIIRELQQQSNMGVIFITHDLGVVAEIADRAAVMYQGQIVEQNTIRELFLQPQHPYTKALLACRPINHPKGQRLPVVSDFMKPVSSNSVLAIHDTQPLAVSDKTADPGKLMEVRDLRVWFPTVNSWLGKPASYTKAVDDVSFDIYKGETLGLVGESGCGKTTLGRALLRLIEPTAGTVLYDQHDITKYSKQELKRLRRDVQLVFQDPYSSLNPRLIIGEAISEPLKVHQIESTARQRKERVISFLEKVNLTAEHYDRYPHEFSGGQRQRIVIARALAMNPSFLVCDESVSALDVSVQAQVLNLLNDLKKELGFTIVFISHDLSVIRYISDRILVMNKGKIEESGPSEEVYTHPRSAYTQKLIQSIPKGILA